MYEYVIRLILCRRQTETIWLLHLLLPKPAATTFCVEDKPRQFLANFVLKSTDRQTDRQADKTSYRSS